MTWTYGGSPGTGDAERRRDSVRFLVGDTDSSDKLLTDEEIAFTLSESSDNVYLAASTCARALASKFATMADVEVDGAVTLSYSDKSDSFSKLASRLSSDAKTKNGGLGVPSAGGISVAEVTSVRENEDRPEVKFQFGQFDHP